MLIVHAEDFARFLEIVPTFASMFAISATAYTALNVMMHEQERMNLDTDFASKASRSEVTHVTHVTRIAHVAYP